MAQRLPPELENKLVRYQNIQAQYNRLVQERVVAETELSEVRKVIELLEEVGESSQVYRLEANILIASDKNKILQELKDRQEVLELRVQKLKKQEEELRKQIDKLANEIREYQARMGLGRQERGAG